MHRAWSIHEIASSIIACIKEWEHPDDEFMTDKSKKALAALARTCRILSPIALDELWANPGDISPILKCLPSDVWNEVKDLSYSTFVFTRDPLPSEWAKIYKHSRRVKSISLQPFLRPGMGYDSAVMDKLVKNFEHWSPRGTCLFPQLRSLSYTTTGAGWEDFPYDTHIPVFLLSIAGPQLVKLDIYVACDRADVNASANAPEGFLSMPVALDRFCKNYPNLESCSFSSMPFHMQDFDTSSISEALDGAITRLPRLSYFKAYNSLSTSWPSAIRNCLSSSRLQRLRLVLCPSTMNALDNEQRIAFSALDDLAIWGSDSGAPARFFDIIDAPRLDRVFVDIQNFEGGELATKHLMEGLARCPKITKLDFRIDNDSDTEVVFYVSSLAPLFKLPTIVNLALRGTGLITSTVGDWAIDQMAQSWPHLQQLTLHMRPCVSVVSLLSLAQYCPQFQRLGVSLDATITPTEQVFSAASLITKPAFCLRRSLTLHEFTTSAWNPKALARILDSLGFEPIPEGSTPDGWTEVMWEMGKLCGTIATTSP